MQSKFEFNDIFWFLEKKMRHINDLGITGKDRKSRKKSQSPAIN